jgi:hypothetical protein
MKKTEQGNFVEILKNTLAEMPEGKIDFRGPGDEFVSVIFIDGDILLIDSTWGTGNDQLQRIYDWETGTCVIKDLTADEKKTLETAWQRPVILEEVKKEAREAISLEHSVEVKALLRDLKRESLDLNAFLAEIHNKNYSGEARISTQQGDNRILFYQGLPLLLSGRQHIAMGEARDIMDTPGATLNFYLFDDELALAYFSVILGEKVWQGLSVTVLHLDKMLNKLMEKNPTGHLCIHKEHGDRHYCFFYQGKTLGVYDIEKHWSPVDISTMWEGAKQVDYYLSAEMGSFLAKAKEMSASEDLRTLIASWNDLMVEIAKKIGKKPVEKSLQKQFGGGLNSYAQEGIRLQLVGDISRSGYDALETFRLTVPDFLKEMETITGSHWLNEQLQDFQERNSATIARLNLTDVFPQKGG